MNSKNRRECVGSRTAPPRRSGQLKFASARPPRRSIPASFSGIVGVAAAIDNAVYHATGERVRDVPIAQDPPERLATRAIRSSVLERNSLRGGEVLALW